MDFSVEFSALIESAFEECILLRYSDRFSPSPGTIELHRNIIQKYGSVWYGKLGLAISEKRISDICSRPDAAALLYEPRKEILALGRLLGYSSSIPDKCLIPSYYCDRYSSVRTWLHFETLDYLPLKILSSYVIASSGASVLKTVKTSSASFFYIRRNKPKHNLRLSRDYIDDLDCEWEEEDELAAYTDLLSSY